MQKLSKMGGGMVLVALNGAPKEVFGMAKLQDVFKISSELVDGLKLLQG